MALVERNSPSLFNFEAPHILEGPFREVEASIQKIYEKFRNQPKIQKSLNYIEEFSGPYVKKYQNLIQQRLVKAKKDLRIWISHDNLYDELSGAWLTILSESGVKPTKELFLKSVQDVHKKPFDSLGLAMSNSFYDAANALWPSDSVASEDIRDLILNIVAKSINKVKKFEGNLFSDTLIRVTKQLVERKRTIISDDLFVNLMNSELGSKFVEANEIAAADGAREFYSFYNRFVFIGYPFLASTPSFRKMINLCWREKLEEIYIKMFIFLNYTLNKILDKLHVEYDDKTVSDDTRFQKIVLKSRFTAKAAGNKIITDIRTNKYYLIADDYLKIENRIDDMIYLLDLGITMTKDNLLLPLQNSVKINYGLIKNKVVITFEGVRDDVIKKNYHKLRKNFEFLQKCVAVVKDETIEFIFDQNSWKEVANEVKSNLFRLYFACREYNIKDVKSIGSDLYSKALEKIAKIKRDANTRRSLHYEEVIPEAPAKVEPRKDSEKKTQDTPQDTPANSAIVQNQEQPKQEEEEKTTTGEASPVKAEKESDQESNKQIGENEHIYEQKNKEASPVKSDQQKQSEVVEDKEEQQDEKLDEENDEKEENEANHSEGEHNSVDAEENGSDHE